MKKCAYCGKEYPDDVARCLIDNECLLVGPSEDIAASNSGPPPIATAESKPLSPPLNRTDRRLRLIEVALVCLIAFGGYLFSSGWTLFFGGTNPINSNNSGVFKWLYSCLHGASALGLLWYVLLRRGKSFLDLGFTLEWKEIGRSIGLFAVGWIAFYAVYVAIYLSGWVVTNHKTASTQVANAIFSGGFSFATILYLFLNPFFEELIVRAYVMTEIKQLTQSTTLAIGASTILQTGYHLYQGVPLAVADGALFTIFSVYYARTNHILPIILAHLYADVGSTLWYLVH